MINRRFINTINPTIKKKIDELKLDRADALSILISLHFGIIPTLFINNKLFIKRLSPIVSITPEIKFHIPFLKEDDQDYEWVKTEYLPLFKTVSKKYNNNRINSPKATVIAMKKFFQDYPSLCDKDEVIECAKMYITDCINNGSVKYIKESNYFINKTGESSLLIDYLNKLRLNKS